MKIGSKVVICEAFTNNRIGKAIYTIKAVYSGCYKIKSEGGQIRYATSDVLLEID